VGVIELLSSSLKTVTLYRRPMAATRLRLGYERETPVMWLWNDVGAGAWLESDSDHG
jgi:hypothetical protein